MARPKAGSTYDVKAELGKPFGANSIAEHFDILARLSAQPDPVAIHGFVPIDYIYLLLTVTTGEQAAPIAPEEVTDGEAEPIELDVGTGIMVRRELPSEILVESEPVPVLVVQYLLRTDLGCVGLTWAHFHVPGDEIMQSMYHRYMHHCRVDEIPG